MNKLLTLTILFFAINIYSQNGSPTCDAAEPLCSDNTGVKIFPNVTNQADQGEYGCLGSTTNATWFYIKVGQTGELKFNIVQNTRFDVNGNPIGTPLDVDYIAWGPFNDPNRGCSSLAENCVTGECPDNTEQPNYYINNTDGTNIVDCSWSPLATESFTIPNAEAGKFYILLISNWDNQNGSIKLEQTNFGNAGAGASDCSIVAGELGADQKVCNDTIVTLDATPASGNPTGYNWFINTGTGFNVINGEINATLTINNNISGIYKAEVTDNSGGIGEDEVEILFFSTPVVIQPIDLVSCDEDGNNFNEFDLSDEKDVEILNVIDPTNSDFEILYFDTLAKANDNIPDTSLPNPHNVNAGSSQTIFARIHNKNYNTCFDIVDFNISVTGLPVPETPLDYAFCDNTSVGSDTDGFVNDFILESKDAEILGTLDPNQYNVSYHTSENGAQTNASLDVIDKTSNYKNTTANTQPIYVRVENVDNIACFDASKAFNLIVNTLPVVADFAELLQCDDDLDRVSTINLTEAEISVSTNYLNETFTYFETQADAILGTPQVVDKLRYPVNRTANVWVLSLIHI